MPSPVMGSASAAASPTSAQRSPAISRIDDGSAEGEGMVWA